MTLQSETRGADCLHPLNRVDGSETGIWSFNSTSPHEYSRRRATDFTRFCFCNWPTAKGSTGGEGLIQTLFMRVAHMNASSAVPNLDRIDPEVAKYRSTFEDPAGSAPSHSLSWAEVGLGVV